MLIEHEPQADGPVYETDGGFQVGRFRQEVPSKRNQGGRPRQVVQGRWQQKQAGRYSVVGTGSSFAWKPTQALRHSYSTKSSSSHNAFII